MNYRKEAHEILKQWMSENNLSGDYVIHHRDDNGEVKAYNKAHYKLWGFNLDGTFEYGKYVVFMTNAEHSSYHTKGTKNPMYGRDRSGALAPMYGRKHSDETRSRMSKNHADFSGKNNPMYGVHLKVSDETREKMRLSNKGITPETRAKMNETNRRLKTAYAAYKSNGGTLSWNGFLHETKVGNISLDFYI